MEKTKNKTITRLIFISFVLLTFAACSFLTLKYKSDTSFLNSAQANSPEYLIYIDGSPCKDMDDKFGLCAKRIRSNTEFKIKIGPRPYSYRLALNCSNTTDIDYTIDIAEMQEYIATITPDLFERARSFTCIGSIFPDDREDPISATFHIRFVVVDERYNPREITYMKENKGKNYVIFGKNAKYVNYGGDFYEKTPYVEFTSDANNKISYSESHAMRFNYWVQ